MEFLKKINRFVFHSRIDTVILAMTLVFVIAHMVNNPYSMSTSITMGNFTLFMAVLFLWGLRLVVNYNRMLHNIDKHVTDDKVRREVFGLWAYDPRDDGSIPKQHLPYSYWIMDILTTFALIGFVALVAIRFIFM